MSGGASCHKTSSMSNLSRHPRCRLPQSSPFPLTNTECSPPPSHSILSSLRHFLPLQCRRSPEAMHLFPILVCCFCDLVGFFCIATSMAQFDFGLQMQRRREFRITHCFVLGYSSFLSMPFCELWCWGALILLHWCCGFCFGLGGCVPMALVQASMSKFLYAGRVGFDNLGALS